MTVLVTRPTAGLGVVTAPRRAVRGLPLPAAAPIRWRCYRSCGCGSELGGTADPGQDPHGVSDPTPLWNLPGLAPGAFPGSTGRAGQAPSAAHSGARCLPMV
jgi:hypothetical protein